MKGTAYKKIIAGLNLSQIKAAVFLGFSARQSRRIASATAELGTADEKLLCVMTHLALTPKAVDEIVATVKSGGKPKRQKASAAAPLATV